MSKAKPFRVDIIDLPRDFTVFGLDAAASTGLARADLQWSGEAGRYVERGTAERYRVKLDYCTASRGQEMRTASDYIHSAASRCLLVYEMAHMMQRNPKKMADLVEARTRWAMAFELAAEKTCRKLDIIGVPASVWQAGWLGLGSSAGRPALKQASELAVAHYFKHAGGPGLRTEPGECTGDAADAVNIALWWIDHQLDGLPRMFASKTSKARRKAKKP